MPRKSSLFDKLLLLAARLPWWVVGTRKSRSSLKAEPPPADISPQPTVETVQDRIRPVASPPPVATKPKVKPPAAPTQAEPKIEPKAPACPFCRKTMVMRVARSGKNAGGNFWGCADYPKCRGIRPIFAPMQVK
ncbi:topoisomerase [Pseudomonas sp. NPDC090202]|uniref:topoisomerase n=1 Tax=unclassified Pseudomonas TaxID=196821 RepID=UPI0038236464